MVLAAICWSPERPEAMLPDRALYLPLLIVNKFLKPPLFSSSSPSLLPVSESPSPGSHYGVCRAFILKATGPSPLRG
jgi:hypothetical protein